MKQQVNIPDSILQKLRNLNNQKKEDFNLILIWYVIERLLYRLSKSRYSDRFVLKGAMLFSVWTGKSYRPTKDLDLLGFGNNSADGLKAVFQEICDI